MRLILLLFFTFFISTIHSQSIEKQLITICQSNDLKVIDKEIKDLVSLSDSLIDYYVEALINYEIIDDFRAYLYQIKENYTIYQVKIISKDNQIVSYEIEQGIVDNNDNWIVKEYIIKNCDTNAFSQLKDKYQLTYDTQLSTKSIFDTSELYYMTDKVYRCFDGCRYKDKRKVFQRVIENQDANVLLNWLKSGNVSLQLYAIEGIFLLSEKGVKFPSNTWNFIQLVQNKKGQVFYAKSNFIESELVYTLVHQIKGNYRKGKRKIKRNSKN